MPYRFYLALTTNPFQDCANTGDMNIEDFGVGAAVGLMTIEDAVEAEPRHNSGCSLDQDIEDGGSSLGHPMLNRHQCAQLQIGRAHVELQSLMRISYAVFCLKQKTTRR